MDPEAFLDLANQVTKLKMFPYFDIAHSVLCALHVREDLGPGKPLPPPPFLLGLVARPGALGGRRRRRRDRMARAEDGGSLFLLERRTPHRAAPRRAP